MGKCISKEKNSNIKSYDGKNEESDCDNMNYQQNVVSKTDSRYGSQNHSSFIKKNGFKYAGRSVYSINDIYATSTRGQNYSKGGSGIVKSITDQFESQGSTNKRDCKTLTTVGIGSTYITGDSRFAARHREKNEDTKTVTPVDSTNDKLSTKNGSENFTDKPCIEYSHQEDRSILPVPVGPVGISELSYSSVTLSWRPPKSYTGKIYYNVFMQETSKNKREYCGSTGPEETGYKVQNLLSGKSYSFFIYTTDLSGLSSLQSLSSDLVTLPKRQHAIPTTLRFSANRGKAVDAVENLHCKQKDNALLLKWQKPKQNGGCPISSFNITTKTLEAETTNSIEGDVCEFLIKCFKTGITYEFGVSAENKYGKSNVQKLTYGPPSAPPTHLQISADNITWKPPEEHIYPNIIEYTVQLKIAENNKWIAHKSVKQSVLSIPIPYDTMKLHTKYQFNVVARNAMGEGPASNSSNSIIKPSVPSPPRNFQCQGENELTLTWDEPDSDGGNRITGYKIKDSEIEKFIEVDANHHKYKLRNTLRSRSKEFSLVARNTFGESDPVTLEYEIKEITYTIPPGPYYASAQQESDDSIEVTWGKPLNSLQFKELNYVIEMRIKGENWKEMQTKKNVPNLKEQKCVIKGLECDKDYFIQVKSIISNIKSEPACVQTAVRLVKTGVADTLPPKHLTKKDYSSDLFSGKSYRYPHIKGLPNVGMSCYANCIFQILGQTPGLLQHLETLLTTYNLEEELSVTGMLIRLIKDLNYTEDQTYSSTVGFQLVTFVIDCICKSDMSFARGEQNDCHSFMMALFNTLKDEIRDNERSRSRKRETNRNRFISVDVSRDGSRKLSTSKKRPDSSSRAREKHNVAAEYTTNVKTPTNEETGKEKILPMFKGYFSLKCFYTPCGHEEFIEKQLFTSLLIPVLENMYRKWSVEKGLDVLCSIEEFNGTDLPCTRCPNNVIKYGKETGKKTEKTVTQRIFCTLPDILVLQIGKFRESGSRLEKMHELVTYKEFLYMTETQVSEGKKIEEIKKKYMLYGVALHSGSIRFGHYTAFVRQNTGNTTGDDSDWYSCNDSSVYRISRETVLDDERAFLLFYKAENL